MKYEFSETLDGQMNEELRSIFENADKVCGEPSRMRNLEADYDHCKTIPAAAQEPPVYLYIVQCSDMTWYPVITYAGSQIGERVCLAGDYPVDVYYERRDIMGSREIVRKTAKNEDDLMSLLEFCGACRMRLLQIWDYDHQEQINPAVSKIFYEAECYQAKIAPQELYDRVPREKQITKLEAFFLYWKNIIEDAWFELIYRVKNWLNGSFYTEAEQDDLPF